MDKELVNVEREDLPLSTSLTLTGNEFKFPVDMRDEERGWTRGLEKRQPVYVFRTTLPFTTFETGATSIDVPLFTLPNYCEVLSCWMSVLEAFAGTGGFSTFTMSVGPNSSETTMLTAQSVTTTGLKKAIGTDFTTNRAIFSTTAGTTIEARGTCNVNTSNLTAGKIEFAFTIVDYTAT